MGDFNRKVEETTSRVGKTVGETTERIEKEANDFIKYLNDEVVPAVRQHSTKALRVAAQKMQELANYINEVLCEHDNLELGAFRFSQRILLRGGKPCGMYFCLHGPRAVQYTAIWETDRNTILFYSSSGERVGRTQLVHAPVLAPSLA